ncbi:hypothetical protein QNO08_06610 [Arthrobacter sp. zg-Y820]|uniref:hypothetical protein n=1 Tax=unclassified Arthrobacter TaxID=235627 RepID=UPI001E4DAB06|nr:MULTISPECIES: hypothetical protein [unclassified Arthrobacter]MCC9197807.1 hypothetical protein [Arthrobacter sp. zg-Y820]MDK1280674.1 hypothetical protein [Arthrobacter sp. zg.Y820]WIB10693.1 hypothetical protein QNO08_06610 [Arthrobacter sp. zg-Y820]
MDSARLQLWWLPVGAGGHVVVHTSRCWELFHALVNRRPPQPLFHSALIVVLDEVEFVIEMSPVWGRHDPSRGVVVTGPVGLPFLGRSRLFRYEVRCWPHGILPDRRHAAGKPVEFTLTADAASALLDRVAAVPPHTWGREVSGSTDMWNSNSLCSWLLTGAGIDAGALHPPNGGRAPGWAAGIAAFRTGQAPGPR